MQQNNSNFVRQPIIAVLGHIDHGKTSLLDAIRSSSVQKKEYGQITQHIGASEIPLNIIKDMCRNEIHKFKFDLKVPGLLFIDTPGHEAFTHLRERGSSIADFAVLVIDISKGIEKQTIESIQILREYKTPFLVAANKIDLVNGWRDYNKFSFLETLEMQSSNVQLELDKKIYELIGNLASHSFNAERFDRVKNFTKEVAIIPVSAKTKTGLSELLLFITAICQKFLEKKLTINPNAPARGTILELVNVKGLGLTMNALIYDGQLNKNDTIIFPTVSGLKSTKVKALMKPKPMTEIRQASSNMFEYVDYVIASAGVKVIANDIQDAIPGAPIVELTDSNTELDKLTYQELEKSIKEILINSNTGIVVKADTLGSLQALVKLLKDKQVQICSASIGKITKDDIAIASAQAKNNPDNGVIIAFHIEVDKETILEAERNNVTIINSMIIYEILELYDKYLLHKKENAKKMFFSQINMPCKLLVLKNMCFRANKPCIFGVRVVQGTLRVKDKLMTQNGQFLGEVKSIQKDKEAKEIANLNEEVAIAMDEVSFGHEILPDTFLYSYFDRNMVFLCNENISYLTNEQKSLLQEICAIIKLSHLLK
ncbi:MAG: translation initiation factor IF-2 [Candidatus Micrarchaeota archaeon]|nr:translation initiation factor IF-2 [Candidatus Micrarchaeota archaeon]